MIVRLYRGKSIISKLIKWQTRGEFTHAAIIIGGELYEAKEFKGVQTRSTTEPKDTDYEDFIVEASALQEDQALEFVKRQLGKPYDYTMVIRFITHQSQETRKSSGVWFCSEFVLATLLKIGIKALNADPCMVNPEVLSWSPILKKPT
jgi:uncharacterized protein YycO